MGNGSIGLVGNGSSSYGGGGYSDGRLCGRGCGCGCGDEVSQYVQYGSILSGHYADHVAAVSPYGGVLYKMVGTLVINSLDIAL